MATTQQTSGLQSGPTQANRVKGFAAFFKSYMSVWTLVVAALPIPVASFKLIPTFEVQRSYLSVYTSLFCFLILGFIFFQRHRLGYYMFRSTGKWVGFDLKELRLGQAMANISRGFVNWLPLACIFLSVYSVFRYHQVLNEAILVAQAEATATAQKGLLPSALLSDMTAGDLPTILEIANIILYENRNLGGGLKNTDSAASRPESNSASELKVLRPESQAIAKAQRYKDWKWVNTSQAAQLAYNANLSAEDAKRFLGTGVTVPSASDVLQAKIVPFSQDLMGWYLTIFISAEAAFILMALKEYLQDVAEISDLRLMDLGTKGGDQKS